MSVVASKKRFPKGPVAKVQGVLAWIGVASGLAPAYSTILSGGFFKAPSFSGWSRARNVIGARHRFQRAGPALGKRPEAC